MLYLGASAILIASKVSIDLQFGMILSMKNFCIAGLYACATFGVHAVDASPEPSPSPSPSPAPEPTAAGSGSGSPSEETLFPIGCEIIGNGDRMGDSFLQVALGIGSTQCSAFVAELNKVDDIGGVKCSSGNIYTDSDSQCSAAVDALNMFDGIAEVGCVGNTLFSFRFFVDAMKM